MKQELTKKQEFKLFLKDYYEVFEYMQKKVPLKKFPLLNLVSVVACIVFIVSVVREFLTNNIGTAFGNIVPYYLLILPILYFFHISGKEKTSNFNKIWSQKNELIPEIIEIYKGKKESLKNMRDMLGYEIINEEFKINMRIAQLNYFLNGK